MLRTVLNLFTGRPTLCVYDVTTRCNSRCSMCGIWKRKEEEMDIEEIGKVFSDLRRFGIHTIFLQGGEPLLRKDILDIVKLLSGMGFHVDLLTNGILLSEGILKQLEEMNSEGRISVTVSLDTFDRKIYKRIRGVDKIGKVLDAIKQLSRHRRLRGGIHATVTSINYRELENLRRFSRENGLRFSFNTYNDNINYASSSNGTLRLKAKEMDAVIGEMEGVMGRMDRIDRGFVEDNMKYLRGIPLGPCDALRDSLRITPDGKLSPCLELPAVSNLRKTDINVHWKGIKRKMECPIRRCYTNTPCFYGCTRGMGSVKTRPLAAVAGIITALRERRS
jgi:MoaA/NifB/PqqE/SkfB family radical SAM enzyme